MDKPASDPRFASDRTPGGERRSFEGLHRMTHRLFPKAPSACAHYCDDAFWAASKPQLEVAAALSSVRQKTTIRARVGTRLKGENMRSQNIGYDCLRCPVRGEQSLCDLSFSAAGAGKDRPALTF